MILVRILEQKSSFQDCVQTLQAMMYNTAYTYTSCDQVLASLSLTVWYGGILSNLVQKQSFASTLHSDLIYNNVPYRSIPATHQPADAVYDQPLPKK